MKKGSKLDELFTLAFMILAIAAVICFFAVDNRMIYMGCGISALALRIIQYLLRYFS